MVNFANIVCKTVGIAGMSAVIYDAHSVGQANIHRTTQAMEADHFEKIHADTRTLSTESPVKSAMQEKVSKLRMNSPLVPIAGGIKGYVSGFLGALGDNIIPVTFASLAIATKGVVSKIGAWGVAGYGLYTLLKEGFGVTKH